MIEQGIVMGQYKITLVNGDGEVLDSWAIDAGDEPGTKPVSSGLLKELCYIAEQAAEEIRKDCVALEIEQGGE